jgi:hypothetical protein
MKTAIAAAIMSLLALISKLPPTIYAEECYGFKCPSRVLICRPNSKLSNFGWSRFYDLTCLTSCLHRQALTIQNHLSFFRMFKFARCVSDQQESEVEHENDPNCNIRDGDMSDATGLSEAGSING